MWRKSSKKMLWNWYFTTVPTSHLMRLTWENPIIAVTLAGDFTVPSWKARRRNGPNVFICAPTKAAYRYLFHQTEDLKIKHFAALDREWLEFIKENRTKGGIQHAYDVVVGPVADDNTMETVQLYLSGILKIPVRYFKSRGSSGKASL